MIPEMPPVESMEAVDIHLRLIVQQLNDIRGHQDKMVELLATRKEVEEHVAALNRKIDGNSPSAFWRRVTEIAVGVVALCTAGGFLIAVFRFLKI